MRMLSSSVLSKVNAIGAICAASLMGGCWSPHHDASTEGRSLSIACVTEVTFSTPEQRVDFLSHHAHQIIDGVARSDLYVLSDSDVVLRFYSGDCAEQSWQARAASATQGVTEARLLEISPIEAERELLEGRTFGTHAEPRACVLRGAIPLEQTGIVSANLPYIGLRNAQVEAANGMVYVATQESCAVAKDVVPIFPQLRDVALEECQNSSLAQCGFPHELDFVPTD